VSSEEFVFDFGPLSDIHEKVEAGQRLSFEDGMRLYQSHDLPALGALAQMTRRRINRNRVFYSINLHINHTNICTLRCLFCAFAKRPGEEGGYAMPLSEIKEMVLKALDYSNINEVHIVGGHNPELGLDYYLDMFRSIREMNSQLFIKALTAPEVDDLAHRMRMSVETVLIQLKEAGLNGLPGGGAEIFAPATRRRICKDKIDAERWLEVHAIAHRLGLLSNVTMLYGHIESDEDRVDHVLRVREQQDQTGGFYSFIPLAYNAENTPMVQLGEAGGYLDLKVYAISRLLLDNVPHIKAHWITTGLKLGQVALSFGIDDLGGTNLNEKIVHDAGSNTPIDLGHEEMERLIRDAGYEPCLVDSSYEYVR